MGKKSSPLYLCDKWSESKFKQTLKSALRSASQHWPPIAQKIKQVERKIDTGEKHNNGRVKYIYQHQCESCKQWFDTTLTRGRSRKPSVQIDHHHPIGGWSDDIHNWSKDLGEMYEKAFCKLEDLTALCKECHSAKTKEERESGAWKR